MSDARKVATGYDASGKAVVEILAAHNALSDDSDPISQCLYLLSETLIRGLLPDERGYGLGGEFGYGANFENAVFTMRCYYWGECDCGTEGHKPTCSHNLPNFLHKRTGQEIRWYKWIGRDMEAVPETIVEWGAIFSECWESIPVEAREKARAEQEEEATPEYQAAQQEAMAHMMDAMDRMFREMQPCYRCSMDDSATFVGGQVQSGCGVKINTVILDDNGACTNCGHVTTEAEQNLLSERQKVLDKSMLAVLRS